MALLCTTENQLSGCAQWPCVGPHDLQAVRVLVLAASLAALAGADYTANFAQLGIDAEAAFGAARSPAELATIETGIWTNFAMALGVNPALIATFQQELACLACNNNLEVMEMFLLCRMLSKASDDLVGP
jgi:hypothetical protein